jgi:hypothetical protein
MEEICNNRQWDGYFNVFGMIQRDEIDATCRMHLKIEVNAEFWL